MKKLLTLLSLLIGALALVSCTAAGTQSDIEPAIDESVITSESRVTENPAPLAMGVHTPADVEAYFAQWPDEHKRRLSDEVVIVFTYPHPVATWVGGAIIYHIPSVSTVYLDFDGNVDEQLTHYESEAGQARLEEVLADIELMQELQAEVIGRWEATLNETTPEAIDPNDPLALDAASYAEEHGISLEEAVARFRLQETMGALGPALEANEAETFAGLWLQHEPEYRLVVAFTENGEETIRPYIAGQPYAELVEVRTHRYSQAELLSRQQEAIMLADELDLSSSSWTDIIENRVVLEVGNPALFVEAVAAAGRELPEPVEVIAIDPENLSDTLQGEVEAIIGPEGQTIYFPKQAPTNAYMEALFEGMLMLDKSGCLRAGVEGSEGSLMIWHHDFELRVTAESIEILNGAGQVVARVGEAIRMGGGEGGATINIPGMPINACRGPYWILGDIESLEAQAIPDLYVQPFQMDERRSLGVFLYQSKPAPEAETLVGALFIDEQGCLRVGDYAVLWPPNVWPNEDAHPLRIVAGNVIDGETVAFVGGEVQLPGAERTAADYRFFENKVPCHGPYWGVARVERQN